VVIVGPTPPPYFGVSNATRLILDSSLNEEFELIYLDTSDRRTKMNFGRFDFTNIYLALKHVAQMTGIVITRRPSVVYIPISQALAAYFRDALFMLASYIGGAHVVVHLRGGYFRQFYLDSSAPVRWFLRRTLGLSDRVIVLGHSLRYLFDGLVPADHVRVVHNGVDADRYEAAAHDADTDRPLRIGYLGNFIPEKGFMEVIQAVEKLSKHHNVECHLAGSWMDDEDRVRCMAYIEEHDLGDIIKFAGVVKGEQKIRFLADLDIFAFPTYYTYEGQPWVVLEAMAAGLPVVTTDHGCIAETIADGETGYLVEKRDADDLAQKLELLVEDGTLRRTMGARGIDRVREIFSEENFIKSLGSVFTEFDTEGKR
jgi:glycosyltransferase involved in cell wall biosynthesis